MKSFYLLFVYLFIVNSCFSQILTGRVTEVNSPKQISYARLEIVHANAGKIADSDGNFSLDITDYSINDTLRISAIGYETLDFLIIHCREFLFVQEQVIIELTPKSQLIDEIVVTSSKSKVIVVGNNIKSTMIVAGFQSRELGSELGTVLKYNKKHKGRILSLNFNVSGVQNDSIPFRVNLYAMKNGLPGDNILKEPIYASTKLTNGIISIDLSIENIYIKDDCLLSIELIEDINFEGLFFNSGFLRSPSYQRLIGQDEWQKTTVDLGFWAEIIYKK